jgi:hypothetical protein
MQRVGDLTTKLKSLAELFVVFPLVVKIVTRIDCVVFVDRTANLLQ